MIEADTFHLAENITLGTPQPSEHFNVSAPYDLAFNGVPLWTGTSLGDLSFDYGDANLAHHVGSVVAVPEPSTFGFLGFGAAALVARHRHKA